MSYQPTLIATAAALTAVNTDQANALLDDWGHYLGPCHRPFGMDCWVLEIGGRPVSVAISASTVSPTVAGLDRQQVVELARLGTAPGQRWATRVMLRLWREVAAPAWAYWPTTAAVAYSANDRHEGRSYRFDGWTKLTDRAGANCGPNATWSRKRSEGDPAKGAKTLWIWRYPEVAR